MVQPGGKNILVVFLLWAAACASAQTREAEVEKARAQKQAELKPEVVSKEEGFLRTLKDKGYLDRVGGGYRGLGLKFGGLITGGGFALGPSFQRDDLLGERLRLNASYQVSFRGFQRYQFGLSAPELWSKRLFVDFLALHHNYPGVQYYGPGPNSTRTGRTSYRLEDTSADFSLGVRPFTHRLLLVGGSAGYLWTNVGPGKDNRFASTDRTYTPRQAPGIDVQSNFVRYGTFAQLDWRDDARGPRAGGNYVLQYSRYEDQQRDRYSFNRIDLDLQQYIPIFNKTRVFALRGRTILTDVGAGNTVPFYLRPTLGGSDDLRGFRPFRFNDNNLLVVNGEYRWEVFSGLDMAVFADGGKVFARRGQLNLKDLEASVGFGMRFNVRNATFIRVDVGFSHEGFQIWFKFNDIFGQRPFGTSTSQPVY